MQIKRYNGRKVPFKLPTIRETKEVQVLWCDDGWAYIPQMKIRRHFVTTDTDILKYTEEVWDGVVPAKVMYSEPVTYSVFNHKKMWMEIGNQYSELYVIDDA
jgi:hypothetical protein